MGVSRRSGGLREKEESVARTRPGPGIMRRGQSTVQFRPTLLVTRHGRLHIGHALPAEGVFSGSLIVLKRSNGSRAISIVYIGSFLTGCGKKR